MRVRKMGIDSYQNPSRSSKRDSPMCTIGSDTATRMLLLR